MAIHALIIMVKPIFFVKDEFEKAQNKYGKENAALRNAKQCCCQFPKKFVFSFIVYAVTKNTTSWDGFQLGFFWFFKISFKILRRSN